MSENKDPKNYVERDFCDERTRRIEQKIDSMKNEILAVLNKRHNNPMPWKAKATIIATAIASAASVAVAFLQLLS